MRISFFAFKMDLLFVLLGLLLQDRTFVEAVIIEDHSACSQIFLGPNGEIKSPDYPAEYPDNLGCVWTIQTNENFRIELNFLDFELEKSAECFDKLIIKDGFQDDAPTLEIFCGSDGKGKTVTSSGNALYLQFLSDESLGEKGIHIFWKEIERIGLQSFPKGAFNDPWVALEVPANIIDFDSGIFMGSLWVIDKNNDVFFYDSKKWTIIPGKLKSIFVNQAGIFGIDPKNKSIYWRHGVNVSSPIGDKWNLVSKNTKRIKYIESTSYDLIYGIDDDNKMFYAHIRDIDILDERWQPFAIKLENSIDAVDENFKTISCSIYSCWIIMMDGTIYSSKITWEKNSNPNSIDWVVSLEKYDYINAGFGNNIWALKNTGDVYKKNGVSSLLPTGGNWEKQDIQLELIRAGIGGVYGLTKEKSFGFSKEVCGGLLYENKGSILSPNYPSSYPTSAICLWIIKPSNTFVINISFDFKVSKKTSCDDYLLIGYPGIQDWYMECGNSATDKRVEANEIWLEFFSDAISEDGNFKINYEAKSVLIKTPSTFETSAPLLDGNWKKFSSTFGLEGIADVIEGENLLWLFTSLGKLYASKKASNDFLNLVKSGIKSLASDNKKIYIIDSEGNILSTSLEIFPSSEKSWFKYPWRQDGAKSIFVSNNTIAVLTEEESTMFLSPLSDFKFNEVKLPFPIHQVVSHPYFGGFVVTSSFPQKSFFTPNLKSPFSYMPLRENFKQFVVTQNGQIWGLQSDGRVALWEGLFSDGSYDNWKVLNVFAERLFSEKDNIYIEDSNGQYLMRSDEIDDIQIEEGNFQKLQRIENPLKIDTYPKEDKIEVWVLGGINGRFPFHGIFDPISNNLKIEQKGNINFIDLSVGESGVWAIQESTGTPYHYLYNENKWLKVPSNIRVKIIESASPIHTVYAIEESENKLYFLNGVSPQNPVGTGWMHIPAKVMSILSTPLKTYVKMADGKWKTFHSTSIGPDLYSWVSSWENVKWDSLRMPKVSAGFDGSVVYASKDGLHYLEHADEPTSKNYLLNSRKIVDFSAGPVVFAIVGQNIYSKTISSCFGFYQKAQVLKLIHRQRPTSLCTWFVTYLENKDISITTNQNNCASVTKIFTGATAYKENKICSSFQDHELVSIEGDRVYIEYKKLSAAVMSDTFQLNFVNKMTELPKGWKLTVPGYFTQLFSFTDSEMWVYNDKTDQYLSVNRNMFIPKSNFMNNLESMVFGWDGIFTLRKDGSVYYSKGFGPVFSEASVQITPKGNTKRERLVFGPQHIFIIGKKDVIWKDIEQSVNNSFAYFLSNVEDLSEDLNGIWIVKSGNLEFYEHNNYANPKGVPLNSVRVTRVFTGHGNKVFVIANDELYERVGISFRNPRGVDFKKIGLSNIRDVKINKNGIFILLADGRLINYEDIPCGGFLTSSGPETLTYPEFATQYIENQHCVWYIDVGKGKEVKISQVSFNLEKSDACLKDSVIIKSLTSNNDSPLVLCGDGLVEKSIQLPSNKIAIEFISDDNENGKGFKFFYQPVKPVLPTQETTIATTASFVLPSSWKYLSSADKKFISIGASIESPFLWAVDRSGYPHFLNKDNWYVSQSGKPSEGLQLSPGVSGVYAIDKNGDIFYNWGVQANNPFGDYWSKMQNNNKILTKLIYGAYNEIFGISKDGEVLSRQGITNENPFGNSWKLVDKGYIDISIGFYGYWLIDASGNIYFSAYIPSANLLARLSVNRVDGNFKKVAAGFGGSVWALNSQNEVFQRIKVNSLNPAGVSWEKINGLKMVDIAAGYDGVYGLDINGRVLGSKEFHCGGIFSAPMGSFSSPGYPNSYLINSNCLYIIKAPQGFSNLEVDFQDFELEESENCYKDYLLLLQDNQFPSRSHIKSCGNEVSSAKFGNRAWFEFFSDEKNEKRGFLGTWKAERKPSILTTPEVSSTTSTSKVTSTIAKLETTLSVDGPIFQGCGGNIVGEGGVIVHPNYPYQYSNGQNCNYVISVDQNKFIQITFEEIDLENSAKCDYDYLEIKDSNDGRIQRFCQKGQSTSFKSSGRSLQIKFFSDEIGQQRGFKIRWKAMSYGKLSCGYSQTGTNGEVKSPNYPGDYDNNLDCFWNITVAINKNVEMMFRDMNIESVSSCSSDFLKIYDVNIAKDLGKFCGNKPPDLLLSSGNMVTVHFHTDNQQTGKGFHLLWRAQDILLKTTSKTTSKTVYEYILTEEAIEITSPNYPDKYEVNKDYYWNIVADPGKKIRVTFNDINIENGQNCKYDYLQIRDHDASGKELGRYCGRNLPQPIISTNNQVFIHFHSDDQQTRTGFKLTLKTLEEVNTFTTPVTIQSSTEAKREYEYVLTGESGEIISPNYPEKYEINKDYYWKILADPGYKIQLTFLDMNIESGQNCKYDYLQIRDNADSGKDLGKFCGRTIPQPIESVDNKIFIHFHSDDQQTRTGFKLKWSALKNNQVSVQTTLTTLTTLTKPKIVEYILSENDGEIISPNYPFNYNVNEDHYWKIEVKFGFKVKLQFIAINVESGDSCQYDFIQVRDGRDNSGSDLGKYCGTEEPAPLISNSNRMFIHFHSDHQETRKGFILKWKGFEAVSTMPPTTTRQIKQTTTSKVIEVELFDSDGEIVSPNYPNNYDNDKDFYWKIAVSPQQRIMLSFISIDVESGTNCNFDYIQVRDGRDLSSADLGKFCGNQEPNSLISSGNRMFIHFHSDKQQTRKGFILKWKAIDAVSTKAPAFLSTISTTLKKVFQFELTQPEGEIISPNFPNEYDVDKDYYWKISVGYNKRILLRFQYMDVEDNKICGYDYIQVLDGGDEKGDELGKYCGNQEPKPLLSIRNQMLIHFHSDKQQTRKGFILKWKAVDAIETKAPTISTTLSATPKKVFEFDLSELEGEVISPNYPNNYDVSKDYYWRITVKPNQIIQLSFIFMEIEFGFSCKNDYIQVNDGNNVNGGNLGKFCGTQKPDAITSFGNQVIIHFHSDNQQTRKGFILRWKAIDIVTTNSPTATLKAASPSIREERIFLTSNSGQISSPNYPDNYYNNIDFYWSIRVDNNKIIQVTFIAFHVDSDDSCKYDFLQIKDGGKDGVNLAKYCGTLLPNPVISSANEIFIHFHSDSQKTGKGFLLNWNAIERKSTTLVPQTTLKEECSFLLSSTEGEILSPNYPNYYEKNKDCIWRISTTQGKKIELNVVDMDVEFEENCKYDYIKILDGGELSSNILETLCGMSFPKNIVSTGNQVLVNFHSDDQQSRRGFKIKWSTFVTRATTTASTITTPDPNAKVFEYILTGSDGEIRSSNYPDNYDINQDYYWTIKVEPNEIIHVSFIDIDIENSPNCIYDYIIIKEGDNTVLGKYCGQVLPNPLYSSGNQMFIHFHSNKQNTKSGFRLMWKALLKIKPTTSTSTKIVPKVFEYTLQGSNGEIKSANYPNNYEVNEDYYWTIKVEPNEIIHVSFIAVDIETSRYCDKDYIIIRDGGSNDNIIGKFCSQMLPNPLRSSGNRMFIHFHSNEQNTRSGFRLKWEALLKLKPIIPYTTTVAPKAFEYTLTGSSGEIKSTNYPSNYEVNQDFYWTIKVEQNEIIRLSFITFDIEESPGCGNDYIIVRDGKSNDKIISKYCGQVLPNPLHSSGNHMFIHFHSNKQNTKSGFKLKWEALLKLNPTTIPATKIIPSVFEYTFQGSNGEIKSTNFPSNYEVNEDYYWTIKVEPNEIIHVSFIAVDIETSRYCDKDYIIIRDGGSNDNIIGKFCGQMLPNSLRSSGNRMFIHFHSNEQNTRSGFRLKWEALLKLKPIIPYTTTVAPKVFEYTLQGSNGEIKSTNFPSNYEVNEDYYWTIKVEPNEIIHVSFIAVDIETSRYCDKDYIIIRDGGSNDNIIGKFCGQMLPNPQRSSGNRMFIHFHSNEQNTRSGFMLKWNTISKLKPTTTIITTVVPKAFKYTLMGKSGEIKSSKYPNNYEVNEDYYWLIKVEPNEIVRVSFVAFNIESSPNCINDYLIARDGESNGYILGRFCGNLLPNLLLSSGNRMFLHFHSNERNTKNGFLIKWEALLKLKPTIPPITTILPNIIVLTESSGEINSLNYPNAYNENSDQYWLIKAQPDEEIKFDFIDLDIENSENCLKDYLQIRDGADVNAVDMGKFCGKQKPSSKTSVGNQIFIQFHSDSQITSRGFRLAWIVQKVAEEPKINPKTFEKVLFGKSGQITSPNYPRNYDLLQDYYWIITVPENKRLQLKFFDMDIEDGENCPYDFIQITDGESVNGKVIGRFCGRVIPSDLIMSGRGAFIHFHSDDRLTKKGFKLMWEAVEDVSVESKATKTTTTTATTTVDQVIECNVKLTNNNGVITSPNYPNHYPKMKDCYWLIVVEAGRVIQLDFEDFDLESGGDCSYDYLDIFDGSNDFSQKIGTYCGNGVHHLAQSTGNQMYLHFRSDDRQTRKGFKLRWDSMVEELATNKPGVFQELTTNKLAITTLTPLPPSKLCKYKVYDRSGTITHPNYPNNYLPNQDCNWYITSPDGTLIVLTFLEMDIEAAGDCFYDYLTVRDGLKSSSPLLGRFCGNSRIPDIRSTSNKLLVHFYSDDRNMNRGFVLKWYAEKIDYNPSLKTTAFPVSSSTAKYSTGFSTEKCEIVFTSPQKQFYHRDYPYSYRSNENCTYKIHAPRAYRVVIYFTLFDLEASVGCQKDYIEIFDGTKDNENLLGRYCGGKGPSTIRTNSNVLKINFITDNSYVRGGFIANYFFEFKNGFTPKNLATETTISRINGEVTPSFSSTTISSKRAVSFTKTPIVSVTKPNNLKITSETNTVKEIQLSTRAPYKTTPFTHMITDNLPIEPPGLNKENVVQNYHYEYEGDNGILRHPNYPENYMNNVQSFWIIKSPPYTYILLQFILFDLEPSLSCNADYLAVYDGVTTSSPLIEKRCLYSTNSIESSGNKMLVVFHSNERVTMKGFLASWESKKSNRFSFDSTLDICNEDPSLWDSHLAHKRIILVSPPLSRLNSVGSTTCVQQFVVSPLQIFKIEFLSFKLSEYKSVMECLDYLSIRDGDKSTSKEIGRFCGSNPPKVLYTSENTLSIELYHFLERITKTIEFKLVISVIDKPKSFGIFSSKYKCGDVIRANSGTLNSVDASIDGFFPLCVWIIETKPSTRIKYFFSNFYLTDACDSSYVILRDGGSSDSTKLGKYCDKTQPKESLLSSSNQLWVEYKGSKDFFGQFSLVWEEEEAVAEGYCGGLVSGDSGYLKSPLYPQNFDHEITCVWNLVVETGKRIVITVEKLHLQSDCSKNYLLLRDGLSSEGRVLERYCGNNNSREILSTSNSMWVELKATCYPRNIFYAFWKAVKL